MLVITLSIILASIVPDKGADGWGYHQLGILSLATGWNPIRAPILDDWWSTHHALVGYPLERLPGNGIWPSSYPKAAWILAANAITNGLPIDSGKFYCLPYIYAAGVISYKSLKLLGLQSRLCMALALALSLNPVSVTQATTFYVDGFLGSNITILIFSLIAYSTSRDVRYLLIALCVGGMAANLKFTGAIFVGAIAIPFIAIWFLRKDLALRYSGLAAILIAACSLNPYVTNMKSWGSPVYPLNRIDVMANQMPSDFLKKDRFSKLAISLFYSNRYSNHNMQINSPITMREFNELKDFSIAESLRIGGFSPFFGCTAVISAIIFVSALIGRTRKANNSIILLAAIAGVIVSVALNPEMWWARLAPQMWIIPVLLTVFSINSNAIKYSTPAYCLAAALCIIGFIALTGTVAHAIKFKLDYDRAISQANGKIFMVKGDNVGYLPALAFRLKQHGSKLKITEDHCSRQLTIFVISGCI